MEKLVFVVILALFSTSLMLQPRHPKPAAAAQARSTKQRADQPGNSPAAANWETAVPDIGTQILEARRSAALNSAQLARQAGITTVKLDKIERGSVMPTRDLLARIERCLHTEFVLDPYYCRQEPDSQAMR